MVLLIAGRVGKIDENSELNEKSVEEIVVD